MEPILIPVDPVHGEHSRPHPRKKLEQHLRDRGMDPELYNVAYDTYEGVITFYLYNGTGDIVGYQQYRPFQTEKKVNDPKEGRYFTYLQRGVDGVFGLETLDKAKKTIYIVEGVFKAAVLHRLGYNAIAVLTSDPKRLRNWFGLLRAQGFDLIAIGDNDKAGLKLIKRVTKGFLSPKDLDEMTDAEIIELLSM